MTWTISHPGAGHRSEAAGNTIRWPRGLAAIGFLSLLVCAWGGIVPYLGPTFSYNADGSSAWTWSLSHSLLWLVPGAVGIVASLAVIARAGGGRLGARVSLAFWGLLLAACAAWFVLGPFAWPVLGEGTTYVTRSSAGLSQFLNLVGYNLGVGIVIALFAGMVLKASTGERDVLLDSGDGVVDGGDRGYAEAPPAERSGQVGSTTQDSTTTESPEIS